MTTIKNDLKQKFVEKLSLKGRFLNTSGHTVQSYNSSLTPTCRPNFPSLSLKKGGVVIDGLVPNYLIG